MENKKTKLTISGNAKKSIKSIEIAKTKGKNSTVIEKSKGNFVKKGSFLRSSGNSSKQKPSSSFNRGPSLKPLNREKTPSITKDFERRKLSQSSGFRGWACGFCSRISFGE